MGIRRTKASKKDAKSSEGLTTAMAMVLLPSFRNSTGVGTSTVGIVFLGSVMMRYFKSV